MDNLLELIKGNLTTSERIWTALAPGIVLTGYFLITLVIYSIRSCVVGSFSDKELEARDRTIQNRVSRI